MIFLLELIGTVAFAISGAIVGIRKKMDVFGIAILAMTTAVGGGILRDVILNITPPMAFRNPVFALSAIATGIAVFLFMKYHFKLQRKAFYESLLNVMDAIGLGLFTVVGVQTAYANVVTSNVFLAVFVGVITGVGGGVLRDVLARDMPYIFTKHFYACASLIGAIVCSLSWSWLGSIASMLIGALIITVLRILAAHYRWSLPKVE
ncbi:MAG: TRIC cation channel family protein [Coriobacteriales bacterium]|nr:TRIC cation channel family protein [Coriobacteriales bacterium]